MKHFLVILLLSCSTFVVGQTTAIPDANFEQVLINYGWDGVIDGQVLTANIDTVTNLNAINSNISSLTGIEGFTALVYLSCDSNSLSSFNVTQNTALWFIGCTENPLTSLDVTQNPDLTVFYCNNTLLTSLDLTQNIALWSLYCYSTPITSLDLTQNVALYELACYNNSQLNCLNLKSGANAVINSIYALNNPNLTCIEVDDPALASIIWSNVDPWASFSTNCPTQCTVGINELSASSISIYPNPTTGKLSISLAKGTATAISISNSLGQLLLSEKIKATNQVTLDLSTYPTGIYFLQLVVDGQVITKKIMKE